MLIGARTAAWSGDETNPEYVGVELYGSSVQLNNGILSGFTIYSYAILPYRFYVMDRPWEIATRVSSNGSSIGIGGIFNLLGSTNGFSPLYSMGNGMFRSYLNNVGWPIWNILCNLYNGYYYIKIVFNGSKYSILNYNGIWEPKAEVTSSLLVKGNNTVNIIGNNRGYSDSFGGLVDLNYSYMYYDGKLLWEGVKGASRKMII